MITEPRHFYKPFEYQIAFDFFKDQHRVHWLADEVPLSSDLNDWKLKLSESEKNLIGNILKSFTQTEVHVNDYWSTKVSMWFPKPEIQSMAVTFGESAYITDQTDAWVILEISGESSREALERICQVDLDKNVFQLDGMARTTMEHMSAIIIRKADDTFYLMSASSSAKSFLHAVELSAQHVS